jgi:hypothetical protein
VGARSPVYCHNPFSRVAETVARVDPFGRLIETMARVRVCVSYHFFIKLLMNAYSLNMRHKIHPSISSCPLTSFVAF